nr:CsbD family protein [Synechococcus sp. PCC 6312]
MKSSGRTQAFGKNIEGHLQEARGNITGNPSDQIAGRAKQVESQARNMVENVKDSVKKAVK